MSSRQYQGKWLTYTQSQALSPASSSQGHLPLHHQYHQHDPQRQQQLLVEMELAELLTTTSNNTGLPSQHILSLPPAPPLPSSQHSLTIQYTDMETPLIPEQAHIPPQSYTIPPSLRDDTNSNNDPFMSCQYYPATAAVLPGETTPVEPPPLLPPPPTSQRDSSRPSSTPAVSYHSTTLSTIADSNDTPQQQQHREAALDLATTQPNFHHHHQPIISDDATSHYTVPTPPLVLSSDQSTSQQQRLTHESWYLSQPYHIGMPQPSHYSHHQEMTYYSPHSNIPIQRTFCPLHKRIIEHPIYTVHNIMEQVHGVIPQQLQPGHQCIPVEGNTLPQDHPPHLQVVETQTALPVEQQMSQSGYTRQLEHELLTPPSLQARSHSTHSHHLHVVMGHPPSVMTTPSSSVETPHSNVPWPLPPSPLSSSFFASREQVPPKPQKTEQATKMLEFAKNFKKKRIELGFSPDGVAQQVNIRFGSIVLPPLCGGLVLKFESGSLAQHDMEKLKQYLEGWLIDTERARGASEEQAKAATRPVNSDKRERKRRTRIDKYHKMKLEEEFEQNCRPSRAEIQDIVKKFGNGLLDCETVRVWFCNQRMRHKTNGQESSDEDDEPEEAPWPKLQRKEGVDDAEQLDDKESVREGETSGASTSSR